MSRLTHKQVVRNMSKKEMMHATQRLWWEADGGERTAKRILLPPAVVTACISKVNHGTGRTGEADTLHILT